MSESLLGSQKLVGVDVGAANGLLPHWRSLDGIATIYQVEPRKESCDDLRAQLQNSVRPDLYQVIEAGVAGTEGERTLYVSNVPTGSSLYSPNPDARDNDGQYTDPSYFWPITERKISTRRLEGIFDEVSERQVDLIKLDIQGAELEALEGLGETRLSNLLCAELEIGLHDIYKEAASFCDVQDFFQQYQMQFFDVRVSRARLPRNGSSGTYEQSVFSVQDNSPTLSARVWEFDAVFFRSRTDVLGKRDPNLIRRMMLIYATYNFFAEAHRLAEDAEKAGILSGDVCAELQKLIVDLHYVKHFRPWLSRHRFWGLVQRIRYRLAPRNVQRWCQYMYQEYPHG